MYLIITYRDSIGKGGELTLITLPVFTADSALPPEFLFLQFVVSIETSKPQSTTDSMVMNIFPLFIMVFLSQLSFELLVGRDDGSPILKVTGRLYFTLTKESP